MEEFNFNYDQVRYESAKKQVKKLKGFYSHLVAYLVINAFILIVNYRGLAAGENFFTLEHFSVVIFWGIGLVMHALSVFLPTFVFNKAWEERKIKELMDKDIQNREQ